MITVDGSQGEGGGQMLRSALALSLVTGQGFTITNIRARRQQPGLRRQHLAAVHAAAEIGRARLTGASLESAKLTFEPGTVNPGDYHFAVGTAGSATLVLQTVLPALLCATAPSVLRLEGGTHNPGAPPFDFVVKTFLPQINAMGPAVSATLVRAGFYPAGGGEMRVAITPAARLKSLEMLERGEVRRVHASARVANLPLHIAQRECQVLQAELGLAADAVSVEQVQGSAGPGNVVIIEVECERLTEVFTGFGERGVRAEAVASRAAREAREYLSGDVPVGEHLADQLLTPLALAGGGAFRTAALSSHARTNMDVIQIFLGERFEIDTTSQAGLIVRARP